MKPRHLLLAALAIFAGVLSLASIYKQIFPAPNPSLPENIPAAVVLYCGFSDLPQPDLKYIVGPDGEVFPIEVWETWQIVPEEDDNPSDGLDPARCERHLQVIVPQMVKPGLLVLNIHEEGPLGITATLGDEYLDDFATDDLMEEMGLKWIRGLDLRKRTFVKLFWITADRQYAVRRRLLTDEMVSFIVSDVAVFQAGISEGFTDLPLPEELQDLPGYSRVQLREQCYRLSEIMEGGTHRFTCEALVDIFIDDATTPDIFDGTVSLTIRPIGITATLHAGAFGIYEPGPDPQSVVEQYGLENLVKEYCQMTKTVIFRLNMYDGEMSDLQTTICIPPQ